MDDNMIIYMITNKVNQKSYIGKTWGSLEKRWYHHVYDSINPNRVKSLINFAILKHGKENFIIKVLAKCGDKAELNRLEKELILIHETIRPQGYNLTYGGDGGSLKGHKKSEQRNKAYSRTVQAWPQEMKDLRRKRLAESLYRPVMDDLGNKFKSINSAANFYGVKRKNISNILSKLSKKLQNGRTFSYIEKVGG